MLNHKNTYSTTMPSIVINANCDTILAIKLSAFNLGDNDEFIFIIKNYDYVDSPYTFIFRTRKAYMDKNGEVIFRIESAESKKIKQGAFYNFALLASAFDKKEPTKYIKLSDNGNIIIKHGAQDITLPLDNQQLSGGDFYLTDVRLEPVLSDYENLIYVEGV